VQADLQKAMAERDEIKESKDSLKAKAKVFF